MSVQQGSLEVVTPEKSGVQMTFRQRVFDSVDGECDSIWEYASLYLIFLSTFVFVIGTLNIGIAPDGKHHIPCVTSPEGDDKCEKLSTVYELYFEAFEGFAVIFFTLEFAARVYSIIESDHFAASGPMFGRIRFILSFYGMIDLIAILPWWLSLFGIIDSEGTQALRSVRLFRLLKAEKYVQAFVLLEKVIEQNGSLLIAASFYALLCLLFSATALYYTEASSGLETAKYFQSIPSALFPCLLMLTGEFPLSEFTVLGQLVASIMAVLAVALFAVPSAILGSGFVRALQDGVHQEFTV